MEDPEDPVAVDLTSDERKLLFYGLIDWGGPSECTEAMAKAIGFAGIDDLLNAGGRIARDIYDGRPVARADWSRALLSAEIIFGSSLVGTGSEWTVIQGGSDADWLALLRGLHNKLPVARTDLPA